METLTMKHKIYSNIIKNYDELTSAIKKCKTMDQLNCKCFNCNNTFLLLVKRAKTWSEGPILCKNCKISLSKLQLTTEQKAQINEKRRTTNIAKFGVETPLVLESSRAKLTQVDTQAKIEKIEKTKLEKYGDKHYNNRNKAMKTMNKKYGMHSSKVDTVIQKKETTCKAKYGNKCSLQNELVKNKAKTTKIKKYGDSSYNNSAKRKITCLEKYGVENSMQNEQIKQKSMQNKSVSMIFSIGYLYNNIHFDSSWELAYYIWLSDNNKQFIYHPEFSIAYTDDNGIDRVYFPDFLVEGKFVEIKGEQFFNKEGEPYNLYKKEFWKNKYNMLIKNNIEILRQPDINNILKYIKNKYGKQYLKSFKIKKD